MSSYEMGAFEALEWIWHILRSEDGQGAPDDAYRRVQDALATMGAGAPMNFKQKITELKVNH